MNNLKVVSTVGLPGLPSQADSDGQVSVKTVVGQWDPDSPLVAGAASPSPAQGLQYGARWVAELPFSPQEASFGCSFCFLVKWKGLKLFRAFCGSWIHSALLDSITAAQNRAVFWLSPRLLIFWRPRACLAGGRWRRGLPSSLPRLLCSSQHTEKTSLEDGSSWSVRPTDGTLLLEGKDGTPGPPSCPSLLPRFACAPLRREPEPGPVAFFGLGRSFPAAEMASPVVHSTGADCHPASVPAEHRSAEGAEQSRFSEPEKHGKQESKIRAGRATASLRSRGSAQQRARLALLPSCDFVSHPLHFAASSAGARQPEILCAH